MASAYIERKITFEVEKSNTPKKNHSIGFNETPVIKLWSQTTLGFRREKVKTKIKIFIFFYLFSLIFIEFQWAPNPNFIEFQTLSPYIFIKNFIKFHSSLPLGIVTPIKI